MNTYYIIYIVSCVVWFLPLLKQKRTEYIWLFILLALYDPVTMLIYKLFHVQANYLSLISVVATIIVLLPARKRLMGSGISIVFLILIPVLSISRDTENKLITLGFLIIILLLVIRFISHLNTHGINLFLSLLIFYFAINFFRALALSSLDVHREATFAIGYAFQILFGILFAFINIDTKNYKLNPKYD